MDVVLKCEEFDGGFGWILLAPGDVFISGWHYYIHEHNDFMKIAVGLLWLN